MSLHDVQESFGIRFPIYVRKLQRKSDWGHKNDDLEKRLEFVSRRSFRSYEAGGSISFYRIDSCEDLNRVAIGLNSTRVSLLENIPLVGFSRSELDQFNICIAITSGATKCLAANKLHVDATASDLQWKDLCSQAMTTDRNAFQINKTLMKKVVKQAESDGCHGVLNPSSGCICERE